MTIGYQVTVPFINDPAALAESPNDTPAFVAEILQRIDAARARGYQGEAYEDDMGRFVFRSTFDSLEAAERCEHVLLTLARRYEVDYLRWKADPTAPRKTKWRVAVAAVRTVSGSIVVEAESESEAILIAEKQPTATFEWYCSYGRAADLQVTQVTPE